MISKKIKSKAKHKKTKFKKNNLQKKIIQFLIPIAIFLLVIPIIGYFYEEHSTFTTNIETKKQAIKKATNEEVMEEVLAELEAKKNIIKKSDIFKNDVFSNVIDINHKIFQKINEIKKDKENNKQVVKPDQKNTSIPVINEEKKEEPTITKKQGKPKIAIIIDDVISSSQKKKILNIGYPVTMSFLPPTTFHKDSAKITQDLPFYMIHLPLQASNNFKNKENNTLKISDSYETIENRVKQLRAWYTNAKYTNNHTGSIFTQDDEAMNKLYKALVKYNFIFVDSKTSADSVVQKYSKQHNIPYISRDIFLDNDKNYKAIKSQLTKAITKAREKGFAVAIGHPYDVTIKVLKESKNLLDGIEPVFINQIPSL